MVHGFFVALFEKRFNLMSECSDTPVEADIPRSHSHSGKDDEMMKKSLLFLTTLTLLVAAVLPARAMQSAVDLYLRAREESIMFRRVALYTAALEQDETLMDARRERGILFYYQGKYDKAIEDLTVFIDSGSTDHRVYFYRALAYLKRHMPERALEDLTTASRLQPRDSEVISYRAKVLYELGRYAEAQQDVNRVMALHDDMAAMARVLTVQGKIYSDQGNQLLARESFKKATAMDPTLGLFRAWANYMSPEQASRIGMLALIVLPVVLIFRLSIPKPRKRD